MLPSSKQAAGSHMLHAHRLMDKGLEYESDWDDFTEVHTIHDQYNEQNCYIRGETLEAEQCKGDNLLNKLIVGDDIGDKVISEYESSGESYASLESDIEEVGYRRSKRSQRTIIFSANTTELKNFVFEVGMKFKDFKECKVAVRNWAVENGYNIGWKKSEEKKLEARCDGDYPWMLYASKMGHEPTFVIKTIKEGHTCVRKNYNRQASSDWLTSIILPDLKRNKNYPAKDIIDDIYKKYGITITDDLCYKAKGKALKQLMGSYESHYANLGSYFAHLQSKDREGKFLLKSHLNEKDEPVFERAYIGFSALRKGFFVGCRRLICFDACFLKTALGGALLSVVSKDANSKMWPIAWAVVEKECQDAWIWFFNHLFEDLNITDGLGWTFMSDKHRGIINGIINTAPHAEHRHCARHILQNWKKQFPGPKLRDIFWAAVMCTNESEFKFQMTKMRNISDAAYQAFMDQEPRRFCKSLISSQTKTDLIHNNICESFNSFIFKCRDMPIIDMLEGIRTRLMTRTPRIVKSLQCSSNVLCPSVIKSIDKKQKLVRGCLVKPALEKKFEVHCSEHIFVVHLMTRECSCKSWALTGIPCIHGIACINYLREDVHSYVDEFYKKTTCLTAYKHYLTPIGGRIEWPDTEYLSLIPPPYVRPPGRPKKNRRKYISEESQHGKQKWSNKGAKIACTRCKEVGHNVRTCKLPVSEVQRSASEQSLKRKGGRPKKQSAGAKCIRVQRTQESESVIQSSQVLNETTPPTL